VRRLVSLGLGIGLLASVGAAGYPVVRPQAAARGAELENFHLAGPIGRTYSIESFLPDSVLIIYFGYTTCWRVCPTALNRIAEAIESLGAQGASVRPVFVDMDPERAVSETVSLYMGSFGPTFLGLTGSPADIERAAKSFGVTVARTRFSTDPTDYAMLHTSPIFVMRPGDPHPRRLPATSSADAIAAALKGAL
jgi:protein SCO1